MLLYQAIEGPIHKVGDSFGVINSLFSGLSFVGIATAFFLQRADTVNSIKELRISSESLRKHADIANKQYEESVRSFASTFHNDSLKQARTSLFSIRKVYFENRDFRKILASFWIYQDSNDLKPETQKILLNLKLDPYSSDIAFTWGLSDVIEYYCEIYQHCVTIKGNRRKTIAIILADRYIWSYWRGILLLHSYEVAVAYDRLAAFESETVKGHISFPAWIGDLYRFDVLAGFPAYVPGVHPREQRYAKAFDSTDYDNHNLMLFIQNNQNVAHFYEGIALEREA